MLTKTDHDKLEQLMAESPENRALIQKLLKSHEENISTISHEILNPLTMVYSTLQILEERYPDAGRDPYWTALKGDVEYMEALLKDLSLFNRSSSLQLSKFSLRPFAEQIALSFAAFCADSKVEFTSRIDRILPAIHADKIKLREMILNLLKNAFEAIDGEGQIRLSVLRADSGLTIEIQDSGCGIPADRTDSIFQPFVTYKKGGTGLGLAIVHRTVSAHRGTISVRSSENAGTLFRISLPIQE